MYISKYWYNYIGGTDDSLTLVDYLYNKNKTQLTLSEIFADTGLDKLNWDFRTSQNLEYTDSSGRVHDFYYAVNVVTDLAALILESRKSGGFAIKDLFSGEKRNLFLKITTTKDEDEIMNKVLLDFGKNYLSYDLSEMVDEDDMRAMAQDCENVRKELYG